MNFETLKLNAFSPKRAAMAAAAALVVFTVASAAPTKPHEPYAVRLEATKTDQAQDILLHAVITDNETAAVVAEPKVTLPVGTSTDLQYGGGLNVGLATRAAGGDRVGVDVTIRRDGRVVQSDTLYITLSMVKYTGDPISMDLKDADLRDVIMTFGKLTGMQIRIDAPVEGKVSVSWHNVPWDQAFDSLLNENGLAYHTEGKTIVITQK